MSMRQFDDFAAKHNLALQAAFGAVETHKDWRCFRWDCVLIQDTTKRKYAFTYRAGLAHCRKAKGSEFRIPGSVELARALKPHGSISVAEAEAPIHPISPRFGDVLSSLQSDCHAGEFLLFEDYCAEYGENADSRATERTWRQCQDIRGNLQKLLGSAFEEFMSLQED